MERRDFLGIAIASGIAGPVLADPVKVKAQPVVPQCSTCKFYLFLSDSQNLCRRFPPVDGGTFAVILNTDWCGEYQKA